MLTSVLAMLVSVHPSHCRFSLAPPAATISASKVSSRKLPPVP